MTLEQAKEKIQQRYHYDITRCMNFHWGEIAIEYAKAKWYEACEAQKELSSEYSGETDYAPNPEFKP